MCVRCLVGFSGCDVSPVYLCSCVSLDNCHAVVGGGRSHSEGPQGPAPSAASLLIGGVSFSPLGFPPSPLLNSTPQSPGLPPPHCREGCSGPRALLQWLKGLPPRPSRPVFTFHSAPLPLVAHNEGGFRGSPTLSAPSLEATPHTAGVSRSLIAGVVSGFSASRSAPPSPPSRHFAEAGGRGEQLQYRGRGRGPSIRAAAPLIGRRRPPRGRGHMRRRRRRRAPQTLCGRADRRTHARTEARALQRPPARARA